ncbi:MAG: PPC domain-containing protein [Bryobacterales bacterium]|nr:PPC domain-containing protein [Bryobacterales bacterium]
MSPRIGAILLSFAIAAAPLWAAKAKPRKLGAVVNPNIIDLVPGTPATVNVPAATTDPVLVGDQFRIDVPEGSAQLRVTLTSSDPTLDLDLHVRYGSPIDISTSTGTLITDFSSELGDSNEEIVVSLISRPAIRAGSYYVAVARWSSGGATTGTLTATVSKTVEEPGTLISQDSPATVILPGANQPTLYSTNPGLRFVVPEATARVELQFAPEPAAAVAVTEMYVRQGEPVDFSDTGVQADYTSTAAGNFRRITIAPDGGIKPGTYYVGFGLASTISIKAGVSMILTPTLPGKEVQSGVAEGFEIDASAAQNLFNDNSSYWIAVPADATRLEVEVTTETANADIDVFAARNRRLIYKGRVFQAEYAGTTLTGNEHVVVTRESSPPLRAGAYAISLVNFSSAKARGTIKVTIVQ